MHDARGPRSRDRRGRPGDRTGDRTGRRWRRRRRWGRRSGRGSVTSTLKTHMRAELLWVRVTAVTTRYNNHNKIQQAQHLCWFSKGHIGCWSIQKTWEQWQKSRPPALKRKRKRKKKEKDRKTKKTKKERFCDFGGFCISKACNVIFVYFLLLKEILFYVKVNVFDHHAARSRWWGQTFRSAVALKCAEWKKNATGNKSQKPTNVL